MKIALIHPPASFNLGNNFFTNGAEASIREVLGDDLDIQRVEFFDSSSLHFRKPRIDIRRGVISSGRSPHFTNATRSWLQSWPDLVILVGGGCLDPALEGLFFEVTSLRKPTIYWQVSASGFGPGDIRITQQLLADDNTIAVITRDPILPKMIGKHAKLISGIDGAFWLSNLRPSPHRSEAYSVINVERKGRLDYRAANRFLKRNGEKIRGEVYFSSNNLDYHDFFRHEKSLLITGYEQLFDLYANASLVVTTRAHTAIASMSSGTPLVYLGGFDNRVKGLFQGISEALGDTSGELELEKNQLVQEIEDAKQLFVQRVSGYLTERL